MGPIMQDLVQHSLFAMENEAPERIENRPWSRPYAWRIYSQKDCVAYRRACFWGENWRWDQRELSDSSWFLGEIQNYWGHEAVLHQWILDYRMVWPFPRRWPIYHWKLWWWWQFIIAWESWWLRISRVKVEWQRFRPLLNLHPKEGDNA